MLVNPLPNGKILDRSKLNAFADNKIDIIEMMVFISDTVENIVEKENGSFCYMSSSFNHNSVSCFVHHLSFLPEEYIDKTVNQEMHK